MRKQTIHGIPAFSKPFEVKPPRSLMSHCPRLCSLLHRRPLKGITPFWKHAQMDYPFMSHFNPRRQYYVAYRPGLQRFDSCHTLGHIHDYECGFKCTSRSSWRENKVRVDILSACLAIKPPQVNIVLQDWLKKFPVFTLKDKKKTSSGIHYHQVPNAEFSGTLQTARSQC